MKVPSFITRRDDLRLNFAFANLHALTRGLFFLHDGHLPPHHHLVPKDFCGVGVATAAPVETDSALIDVLDRLGVRQVRLDFTYGDHDNHVGRFLDALCANGYRVMLHLVQPLDEAKKMPSEQSTSAWQAFIRTTLEKHAAHVEVVEVCSTINRRRWAGYSLNGFLKAWAVAHDQVRAHRLELAGPNVTDFEPPWTVGVMTLLNQCHQTPDIHTNNLFAERSTEPERWDHKILGRRLAPLFRINLIKKARILQRIGGALGTSRFISPAAFWTLPRIERLLPDSEQKQADYLTRYMLLCAASGALERAYWGPLVCHREGLVDDGDHAYPQVEHITRYSSIEGELKDFRIRPAFHALAAFNRLIPGTRYEGRLNHGQGLEVHCFSNETHRIHAIWTVNGSAAASCDLYKPADLALAQVFDRDGSPLAEQPTLFSETPVYLLWPVTHPVTVMANAGTLPGVTLHRHAKLKYYYYRDREWHGIVRAACKDDADELFAALHPQHLPPPDASAFLRHARNAIWTIQHPLDSSRKLVIKKPVKHHLHKKLLDRLKPSKALRSWSGANELERRGLTTASPVAWFEERSGKDITHNWYICDHLEGQLSVSTLFSAFSTSGSHPSGITPELLYPALTDFVLRMHGRGIFFRDLSGGNILVKAGSGANLRFALIDTARLHAFEDGTPLHKRLADMSRLCHKLDSRMRKDFMKHYLGQIGRSYSLSVNLRFRIYDLKATIKRALRRTRLYKKLKY